MKVKNETAIDRIKRIKGEPAPPHYRPEPGGLAEQALAKVRWRPRPTAEENDRARAFWADFKKRQGK